jgi:hypothetical protein
MLNTLFFVTREVSFKMDARTELNTLINKQASTDPTFKNALMADPRGTLNKYGLQIPGDVAIGVKEEAGHLVVDLPASASGELTDAALDNVAGGGCHKYAWTVSCSGSSTWTMVC